MWPFFKDKTKVNAARKEFLAWLGRNHPNIASHAMRDATGFDSSMASLGADYVAPSPNQSQNDSWWNSLVKGITEAAPSIIGAKQQYDLMKLNLRRADQGLPPIDSSQYAPTVRVQAEASPQTNKTIFQSAGVIGIAIAAGLGAIALFGGKRRGRR